METKRGGGPGLKDKQRQKNEGNKKKRARALTVGVSDARGELAEGAGVARVRVGAEEHLAGQAVPLLGEGHVTHALVVRVGLEVGAAAIFFF